MEIPNTSDRKSKAWYQVWWEESVWPGLGLFGESYVLFSIGTLRPVWELLYPDCWSSNNNNNDDGDDEVCSDKLLHSLSYNVVMGVICGMIIIGTLANRIGRRNGSILTAFLMASGGLGLCASSLFISSNPHYLFSSMSALLFIFGIGVGGEYPLSASSASERAMTTLQQNMEREKQQREQQTLEEQAYVNFDHTTIDDETKNKTGNKGKRVILVFAMQGMGIFINSLTLTFLLMVTNQFGSNNNANAQGNNNNQNNYYWNEDYDDGYVVTVEGYYNKNSLLGIWRLVYAIGAGTLAYVLVSRMYYLEESQVWKEDQERREYMMTKEVMRNEMRESSVRFSTIDGDFVPDPTWDQPPLATSYNNEEPPHPPRRMSFFSYKFSSMRDMTQSVRQSINSSTRSILTSSSSSSQSEYFLLFKYFGMRLFGTSMSWLLWDVAFYGNKLFQSSFLLALTGDDATLMQLSAASTLNAFIALLGYFAAAFIIDNPKVGRLRLQKYGFIITGSLFCICGLLRGKNLPSWLLIVMYFGSSFFGQCGPNCTTFVYPAEVFPTEMRTMCHGVSASAGKVGALLSAVLFNYIASGDGESSSLMFFISGYCSFAAFVITYITLPETVTLDLYELDKKWRLICTGKKHEYEGPANEARHLSYYECKATH